jgi:hypothetical protein
VVPSKGCEVVGQGYSRVIGVAAKVMDKKENLGNHGRVNRVRKIEQHFPSRVNRVSQNSNMDRQVDRVGRVNWVGQVTRVSPSSSMDQRTDQASRVNRVGSTEQEIGGSSRVANMKVWVTENSANMESQIMENSANMESQATENLANRESQVTENLVNM